MKKLPKLNRWQESGTVFVVMGITTTVFAISGHRQWPFFSDLSSDQQILSGLAMLIISGILSFIGKRKAKEKEKDSPDKNKT